MRATKILNHLSLVFFMTGLAPSLVGCEDTFQADQIGEMRDAANGCRVRSKTFRREVEGGDRPQIVFAPWCAIFKDDKHMYCFATNGHVVVSSMLYYRELAPVPDSHPDLACWAQEIKSWASLNQSDHPLRDKPTW